MRENPAGDGGTEPQASTELVGLLRYLGLGMCFVVVRGLVVVPVSGFGLSVIYWGFAGFRSFGVWLSRGPTLPARSPKVSIPALSGSSVSEFGLSASRFGGLRLRGRLLGLCSLLFFRALVLLSSNPEPTLCSLSSLEDLA